MVLVFQNSKANEIPIVRCVFGWYVVVIYLFISLKYS